MMESGDVHGENLYSQITLLNDFFFGQVV